MLFWPPTQRDPPQVFPAPHNPGQLDETLASEPCFLEYAVTLHCLARSHGFCDSVLFSYRYRNWRIRPVASEQSSDSGLGAQAFF